MGSFCILSLSLVKPVCGQAKNSLIRAYYFFLLYAGFPGEHSLTETILTVTVVATSRETNPCCSEKSVYIL